MNFNITVIVSNSWRETPDGTQTIRTTSLIVPRLGDHWPIDDYHYKVWRVELGRSSKNATIYVNTTPS